MTKIINFPNTPQHPDPEYLDGLLETAKEEYQAQSEALAYHIEHRHEVGFLSDGMTTEEMAHWWAWWYGYDY